MGTKRRTSPPRDDVAAMAQTSSRSGLTGRGVEREFFHDTLPVRIHWIIVMIRWTGLAPWEFEFPFPGSLTSTFLARLLTSGSVKQSTVKPNPTRLAGLKKSEPITPTPAPSRSSPEIRGGARPWHTGPESTRSWPAGGLAPPPAPAFVSR